MGDVLKKQVVIFGASTAGAAAYKNLCKDYDVIAFCDNDASKVGSLLETIPIISVVELKQLHFDTILIASEYFEQISHQLISDEGISPEVIQVLHANQIKSFHFGDNEQQRESAEKVLFALCKVLKHLKIKYHLDAGTLLGVYRDKALIPWDDDLDIAVTSLDVSLIKQYAQVIADALEKASGCRWGISELFADKEFGLVPKGQTRSFKLSPNNDNEDLPLIDLFVKYLDAEHMDYVIASRGFSMASRHMKNVDTIQFKQQTLHIPSDVEGYLTAHYGDWQTPNPNWNLSEIKSATVF